MQEIKAFKCFIGRCRVDQLRCLTPRSGILLLINNIPLDDDAPRQKVKVGNIFWQPSRYVRRILCFVIRLWVGPLFKFILWRFWMCDAYRMVSLFHDNCELRAVTCLCTIHTAHHPTYHLRLNPLSINSYLICGWPAYCWSYKQIATG